MPVNFCIEVFGIVFMTVHINRNKVVYASRYDASYELLSSHAAAKEFGINQSQHDRESSSAFLFSPHHFPGFLHKHTNWHDP